MVIPIESPYSKMKLVPQGVGSSAFSPCCIHFAPFCSPYHLPLTACETSHLLEASQPLTSIHRRLTMHVIRVWVPPSQMFLQLRCLCNCCIWLSTSPTMPLWPRNLPSCRLVFHGDISLGSVQTSRGPQPFAWYPALESCLPLQQGWNSFMADCLTGCFRLIGWRKKKLIR